MLIFITRLARLCLRSLHHRYVAWSKPNTTSLLLGTLTDLTRSKPELVAEHAFLRKPPIILQRQVKPLGLEAPRALWGHHRGSGTRAADCLIG